MMTAHLNVDEKVKALAPIEILRDAMCEVLPDRAEAAASMRATDTIDELGIESVAALEMAGSIEDALDVEFSDDELARIYRVQDFLDLIERYRS